MLIQVKPINFTATGQITQNSILMPYSGKFSVVGDLSPNTASASENTNPVYFHIYQDTNNYCKLYQQSGKLIFDYMVNGVLVTASITGINWLARQVASFAVVVDTQQITLWYLKNNAQVQSATMSKTNSLVGTCTFCYGGSYTGTVANAVNTFMQIYVDQVLTNVSTVLAAISWEQVPNNTFQAQGKWSLPTGGSIANNTLTINSSTLYVEAVQWIALRGNTQYILDVACSANGFVYVEFFNGATSLGTKAQYGTGTRIVNAPDTTDRARVVCSNNTSNICTFTKVSLKAFMQVYDANSQSIVISNMFNQDTGKLIPLTRTGLAIDPTTAYNPTSLMAVNNNTYVTHGNNTFIGGNIAEVTADFLTKVANSSVECPLKLYYALGGVNLAALPTPTVAVTNLIVNGNFTGTTSWANNNATMSAANNELTMTATATGGKINQSLTSPATYSNHKFYLGGYVKSTSSAVYLGASDNVNYANKLHSGSGNYELLSCIYTVSASPTGITFMIQDNRTSGWTAINAKLILAVDLTTAFGAGNEPDVATCDIIFATWFNGTITSNGYWKEITTQSMLDKLDYQDEVAIATYDAINKTATWNNKNFVLQSDSQPLVLDDFKGKIYNDTNSNPNIFKTGINAVPVPGPNTYTETNTYGDIDVLNGVTRNITTAVNGMVPIGCMSMNVIADVEGKIGTIPTIGGTLAEKVSWAQNNISKIVGNGYINGTCPTGNKVYLSMYRTDTASWDTSGGAFGSNTASTPTLTTATTTTPTLRIDNNGFVHFAVYTDQSSTTSPAIVVLTNHGLTGSDVIENTTRNALAVVLTNTVNTNVLSCANTITNQVSGDSIRKYHNAGGNKTAESGTTDTIIKITNHGLTVGEKHVIKNGTKNWAMILVTATDANTLTAVGAGIAGQTSGDTIQLYGYTGTQTAESTVIPSTVYIDYFSIAIQLKSPNAGYDVLVWDTPRRDAGLGNAILMEKSYASITSDYTGKISGDNNSNPNVQRVGNGSTLVSPTAAATWGEGTYSNILTQNGVCFVNSINTNGSIAQNIYGFNMVAIFEKLYGTIPSTGTDLASKIAWLKTDVNSAMFNWVGWGSGPNGNRATACVWHRTTSLWSTYTATHTASTPTQLLANESNNTGANNIQNDLCDDGFLYFIAYADASDGVTASVLNTDYVSLQVTFKNGNNCVVYFNNNSAQMATQVSGKAPAYMIEADFTTVCNTLYGGNNTNMKNDLKAITADAYVGSIGNAGGTIANGASARLWVDTSNAWGGSLNYYTTTNSAAITKTSPNVPVGDGNITKFLTTTNKMYLLLSSGYASNGTILSTLSLDYMRWTVWFNRISDTVTAQSVVIPSNGVYSICGDFSPAWTNSSSKAYQQIFSLYNDSNNNIQMYYYQATNQFLIKIMTAGNASYLGSYAPTINKWQTFKFVFCSSTGNNLALYILPNNGTLLKSTLAKATTAGVYQLYPLSYWAGSFYGDSFNSKMEFLPGTSFDDTSALVKLQQTDELFDITKVTNFNFATYSVNNQTITVTVSSAGQWAYVDIPVLPNNKYQVSITCSGGSGYYLQEFDNNVFVKTNGSYGSGANTVVMSSITNKLRLNLNSRTVSSGTLTFSNISVQLKMQ